MIMFGLKFMDDVSFREVYIHGLVRDADGNKMSKSKGNVLDPLDLIDGISLDDLLAKRTTGLMQPEMAPKIEKATRKHFPDGIPAFGTDALRFTFAALATTGRDIRFDLGRIEGYRNFCNKLWNATRFVLQNCEDQPIDAGEKSLVDRWIESRLYQVAEQTNRHMQSYRFDLVSRDLYEFLWNDYCDWYIELCKPVLYSDTADEKTKAATRHQLLSVLETSLRLLHPIMPYITEELWQRVAAPIGIEGDTIMFARYPQATDGSIDEAAVQEVSWIQQVIMGVRQIRSEMDIPPSKPLPVYCQHGSSDDEARLTRHEGLLTALAKLESITWLPADEAAPESATSLVGDMQILIPLAGLIDKDAELSRLQKNIERLEKEVARVSGKLANSNFTDRAPAADVQKEREKLQEAEAALESLKMQSDKIKTMD